MIRRSHIVRVDTPIRSVSDMEMRAMLYMSARALLEKTLMKPESAQYPSLSASNTDTVKIKYSDDKAYVVFHYTVINPMGKQVDNVAAIKMVKQAENVWVAAKTRMAVNGMGLDKFWDDFEGTVDKQFESIE